MNFIRLIIKLFFQELLRVNKSVASINLIYSSIVGSFGIKPKLTSSFHILDILSATDSAILGVLGSDYGVLGSSFFSSYGIFSAVVKELITEERFVLEAIPVPVSLPAILSLNIISLNNSEYYPLSSPLATLPKLTLFEAYFSYSLTVK